VNEIMERINAWYEEVWDGTLHCHMEWCVRGAALHKELSQFIEAEKDE